jgi:hypothetical protein
VERKALLEPPADYIGPMICIAISLAAYQAIARPFLAAHRIKVKHALFNEIATSGYGARDGRLPCASTKQTPHWSARLCRGRSASPHRL